VWIFPSFLSLLELPLIVNGKLTIEWVQRRQRILVRGSGYNMAGVQHAAEVMTLQTCISGDGGGKLARN
jgi:hypothetical protein